MSDTGVCPKCGSTEGVIRYYQIEKWVRTASFDSSEVEYTEGDFVKIMREPKTGIATCCGKRVPIPAIR